MGRNAAKVYCGMHGDEVATQNKENIEAAAYATQTDWKEDAHDKSEEQSGWKTVERKKQAKKKKNTKTPGQQS